jgi:hypothetical protein
VHQNLIFYNLRFIFYKINLIILFQTISKLMNTWLLPLNLLVICFLGILFYRLELINGKWLWRFKIEKDDERFCSEVFFKYIWYFSIISPHFLFFPLYAVSKWSYFSVKKGLKIYFLQQKRKNYLGGHTSFPFPILTHES